jgi:hypothetical protein
MTAKLTSRSVCFEPISKSCFVSGHDFSRAEKSSRTRALAPAALFPSQFSFGSARVSEGFMCCPNSPTENLIWIGLDLVRLVRFLRTFLQANWR